MNKENLNLMGGLGIFASLGGAGIYELNKLADGRFSFQLLDGSSGNAGLVGAFYDPVECIRQAAQHPNIKIVRKVVKLVPQPPKETVIYE
jgi:hypothetical protein